MVKKRIGLYLLVAEIPYNLVKNELPLFP